MNTKEMIEVMQAYEDGKTIQVRDKEGLINDWSVRKSPCWDWSKNNYRIKPTPTYRPYKPEELMQLKGKWLIHKSGGLMMVISISSHGVGINHGVYNSKEMLEIFTHEDGSPCGILEEL